MLEDIGCVIWLTGLSGAGKSTIAKSLSRCLWDVEVLDGDEVRTNLSKGLSFSKEDRDINILRIGYVARLLAKHGAYVVVAAISPYREAREQVRHSTKNFVEVYCKASLDTLKKRDPKGLYKRVLAGEIKGFTGIDDPYEEPMVPDLTLDTENTTVEECVTRLLNYLVDNRLISEDRVNL
jgi:adenylyl-sulfate kinase